MQIEVEISSIKMQLDQKCKNYAIWIVELLKKHSVDQQRDLSVQDADYESSASYACQKSWTISSELTEQ